jgi:hypothetical protein
VVLLVTPLSRRHLYELQLDETDPVRFEVGDVDGCLSRQAIRLVFSTLRVLTLRFLHSLRADPQADLVLGQGRGWRWSGWLLTVSGGRGWR